MFDIKIYSAFFDTSIIKSISNNDLPFLTAWKLYTDFHKTNGHFDRKNSILILESFKFIYHKIPVMLPDDFLRLLTIYNIEQH